jgi:hypothetical protein
MFVKMFAILRKVIFHPIDSALVLAYKFASMPVMYFCDVVLY